jgi:hypothetical protein
MALNSEELIRIKELIVDPVVKVIDERLDPLVKQVDKHSTDIKRLKGNQWKAMIGYTIFALVTAGALYAVGDSVWQRALLWFH